MTASDKINQLLIHLKINAKAFSERLGYDRPQIIYDIQKGKTKRISVELADKIASVFAEVNRAWLLADEGEMLRGDIGAEGARNEAEATVPSGESCSEISSRFLRLLEKKDEQIERKDEQIGKKDEQIDRLLALLEAAGRGR